MIRRAAAAGLVLASLAATAPAAAQVVEGRAYEDRDGDGIRDPGEPAVPGVSVRLFGTLDAGGSFDQTVGTDADGLFSFSPGDGCYLLLPQDPPGWRHTGPRWDGIPEGTAGYTFPVGQPRPGVLDQGIANLLSGSFRYASMGDSIAWNWNSCFFDSQFWYSKEVRSRLACVAPGATVQLGQAAVKGEHTDDLLVDDTADLNNVFRIIENQPQLITLSMIGNDLLDVEPSAGAPQSAVDRAAEEILDARNNLQEALSAMVSEIPGADITLNTLYDNLAYRCYAAAGDPFHRDWLPIVNRILRDLAWGQTRRLSINEAAAEFAREDLAGGCTGFDQMICRDFLQTDQIHPNNNGYRIMREKVWEATGGVLLGPSDALARTSQTEVDHGFLRHVRRLLPTSWEVRNGAAVLDPGAALNDADSFFPAAITLGTGTEEFRLSGFADYYDEIEIVRALVGVRYRTAGVVNDDFYRMQASVTGAFEAPPGHAYTPTAWNFYTPIVGGGGPNQPASNPDYPAAALLVLPNVPAYREVSATLSKDPVVAPSGDRYDWPPIDVDDLASATVRVAAAPVAGTPENDEWQVELDAAWIDLYGWEKPRPPEAQNVALRLLPDGSLQVTFDEVAGATRYNVYLGRVATVRAGLYDHGSAAPAGPRCDAPSVDAGGGRRSIVVAPEEVPADSAYVLVTGHVDDVESPAGFRSTGAEIDRAQSICR